MKPLFYIMFKSIKNGILELKKKPGKLVMYILFIFLLGFSFLGVGKGNKDTNFIGNDIYGCMVTGLILLFTVPDIMASFDKGATFFRGADINFVFTAPIKPQNILIYGFVKQMYAIFISLFFLLFQVPNLYRFFDVKSYAIFVIIIGLCLLLIANSIIKLILYSIISKNSKAKNMIIAAFKGFGILVIIFYFACLYIFRSPLKALMYILNNKAIEYIPVYGWVRTILMSAVNGTGSLTIVFILLTMAFIILCFYALYRIDMDYYEDVLTATEVKESTISKARTGQRTYGIKSKRKVKSVKYTKKGSGASAIFFRHFLECSKTGFGLISTMSIIYFIAAITVGVFCPPQDLRLILGFSAYLLMIFSFAGKWQKELSTPYVYLIPDSAFKKVIYSTAMDNIKNLVDGCFIFIPIGFLFKSNPITILLSILGYVSIGCLFVYGGLLIQRMTGSSNNMVFVSILKMLLLILIIAPGVILMTVFSLKYPSSLGQYASYLIFITYNLFFSSIIILLSKGIFENIELN